MYINYNNDITLATSFRTKVIAGEHIYVESIDDANQLMNELHQRQPLIVGGGSNYLFVNEYPALIVSYINAKVNVIEENSEAIIIEVGAGFNWHELVLFTLSKGWFGLENLSLIPGNVGGAPIQNIGAYGSEVSECINSVYGINLSKGDLKSYKHSECLFRYRSSIFKNQLTHQFLITSVRFTLSKTPNIQSTYPDVKQMLLDEHILLPTPKDISEIIIRIRNSKLPDPSHIGNAGSFFKNPVISNDTFTLLKASYPNIPSYPQKDMSVKLAAAWLIDQCGWKGYRINDAGVHDKQALVLVNYGTALGTDIHTISMQIQASVFTTFGIQLEPEVTIVL